MEKKCPRCGFIVDMGFVDSNSYCRDASCPMKTWKEEDFEELKYVEYPDSNKMGTSLD